MSVIVGIDIAKSKFDYRIITEGNDQLSKGSCKMNHEGFSGFISDPEITKDAMFVMESTNFYHIPLFSFLQRSGFDVRCVNPLLIRKQVMADSLRRTKTDSADALSIAKYGKLHYDSLKGQKSRMDDEVKAIVRRRQQVVEDVVRTKNQLKGDLSATWPEILAVDVFSETMLAFLSKYGCAQEVLATPDDELRKALVYRGGGKGLSYGIEDIKKFAKSSIGVSYRSEMVKDSAEKLISLKEREKRLTQTLLKHEESLHSKDIEILKSIPGIGDVTACHFMAEIEDISKFGSYQKLIAFVGTDPGIYQSGQQSSTGHITKHGNSNLRRVCYIMATRCVTYNPIIGDYYNKKRAEGFSHRKAMIAAANKLIKLIYVLLSRGEMFKIPER